MPPVDSHTLLPEPEVINALLELSSEAIWVNDLTTGKRYWYVSESNRLKYNIPHDNIGPEFWLDNIHPDDLQTTKDLIDNALNDHSVTKFDCRYRFRGGQQTYYSIHDKMLFIRNAHGKALRIIGVWSDITALIKGDEKKQELLQKLENDNNRFRIVSEFSNAVMWEVDIVNSRVHWTSGTRTLEDFGLTKRDYTLNDWEQSIHPDDKEISAARFKAAVQSQDGIYNDEYRIVKSDGSVAYVIDRGVIIRDDAGNAVSALGGWVDVTAARLNEETLRTALEHQERMNEALSSREEELASSEEELRQVNEHLSLTNKALLEREQLISRTQQIARIGSWEYDPHTRVYTVSDSMLDIYGVASVEDFRAGSPSFYGDKEQYFHHLITEAITKHKPFEVSLQIRTPLGRLKWLRICGWPRLLNAASTLSHIYGITYDITYLKEAEELLRLSEEKFSKVFHRSPDLTILLRANDWIIVDINNNVQPMLGYTRQELLGVPANTMRFFVYQHEREYFYSTYDAKQQVEMSATLLRKDGREILALLSFNTVDFNGQQHIIATIKDISNQKAAEDKFTRAFELSPDLMLILRESDWVLVDCNSKITSTAGYSRDELLGKSTSSLTLWVNDEDRQRHNEMYYGNGSATIESQFVRKDGTSFYGTLSSQRIALKGVNHILVVVRDITEQKIAERKLLDSEANLYATINNTNLLVWSVDVEFRVIKANKTFIDYMLRHYNTVVKQGERIIAPDKKVNDNLQKTWHVRYNRALQGESFKIKARTDDRHVEYSISPIVEENTNIIGISVFAEDISKRVKQEEDLKEAMDKIAELKLTALRSVMNPHFIFNALNSIQYFIAQNDRKNAINYLSTFSKLVRSVLTHSVNNKISLREETEMLTNYIALEQIRFENKFDYVIYIDQYIDLEGTTIPPLLIQPYVENAILHGLYNKEGRGHLNINFSDDEDALLVEIRDDGVGRAEAKALREKNFPLHKSMGTTLTEERLRLINAHYKVSFEVLDLYNESGKPAGTSVKIWISQ